MFMAQSCQRPGAVNVLAIAAQVCWSRCLHHNRDKFYKGALPLFSPAVSKPLCVACFSFSNYSLIALMRKLQDSLAQLFGN